MMVNQVKEKQDKPQFVPLKLEFTLMSMEEAEIFYRIFYSDDIISDFEKASAIYDDVDDDPADEATSDAVDIVANHIEKCGFNREEFRKRNEILYSRQRNKHPKHN